MTFAAAPEYQVFPTPDRPLKPYAAAVRAAREIQRVRDPRVRARTWWWRTSSPPAPALAARARGRAAGRRSSRTCYPIVRAGLPDLLDRRAAAADAARARALWRRARPRCRAAGAGAGARASYNEARARLGLPPLPYVHTGLSRELTMVGDASRSSSTRARWPAVGARRRAAAVGAAGRATSSRRRATGRSCWSRPRPSQDPEHRLLRAALEGLADEPVRVIATYNGREPVAPIDGARRTRVLVAVGLLRADDAAVRRRGLPRRPRDARARAGARAARWSPARRRGDMAENAARVDWAGVGRAAPAALAGARGVRLAVRRALRPAVRARAAEVAALGGRPRRGRGPPRRELEAWLRALRCSSRRRAGSSPRS